MPTEWFRLINAYMDRGNFVIELGQESFPFYEDESPDAKVVLKVIKPNIDLDSQDLKAVLASYDEPTANLAYDIKRSGNKGVLKLENEHGDTVEIIGNTIEKASQGYSAKEIMRALKQWRSQYEETMDLLNASEKKLSELLKLCKKELEITKKKQAQASWLSEPNKSKLAAKIETLEKVKSLLEDKLP